MTKAEIIDRIAHGTGLTKIETEAVVEGFIATLKAALKEGRRVDLRGFGTFKVQQRAARTARNPRTNQEVEVAAHYVPVFKASRELQKAVDTALQASEASMEDE